MRNGGDGKGSGDREKGTGKEERDEKLATGVRRHYISMVEQRKLRSTLVIPEPPVTHGCMAG